MGVSRSTKKIKSLFLKEKPADILVTLNYAEKMHLKKISERNDVTYSHAVRIMNKLKDSRLVESEKHGRKREYFLTPDGKELADHLSGFFSSIGEDLDRRKLELNQLEAGTPGDRKRM